MITIRNIGVFCGSSIGKDDIYKNEVIALGKAMAENNMNLIFGGGNIGLMRVIADIMVGRNKKVVGIMPYFLAKKEIAHHNITEMIFVDTMEERKQKIIAFSDAFIAMPGGFGTLDEISDVLTGFQLNLFNKPLALYNVKGYFDHFLRFLDVMVQEGFLCSEHRNNIIVEDNPQVLLKNIIHFQPEMVPHKWVDKLKEDTNASLQNE